MTKPLGAIAIYSATVCQLTESKSRIGEKKIRSPSFPYHRPRTYPLFCPRGPSSGARFGNWQNATMVRALINGAPVAAPVTMQFALRARRTPRTSSDVCIAGQHRPLPPLHPLRARVLSQRSDKAVTRVTR